jgi:hypothetical protein
LSALDSLAVDLSSLLFTEAGDLRSGSLGEEFVIRLGDFLLFLLDGSSCGSYSSLILSSAPSSITSFDGGSLRSVVLVLSILFALLFG